MTFNWLINLFENVMIVIEDRGGIMDFIITFFRDVLDGPLYIGVVVLNSILICSCIGYLGEQYLNKQKQKQEYEATHVNVATNVNAAGVQQQVMSVNGDVTKNH